MVFRPKALLTSGVVSLLALMTAAFFLMLPHVKIDMLQETWYLGVPHELISKSKVIVSAIDPFLENGPHTVYPPAAIVYFTGSMRLMRAYQFSFSLMAVSIMFWLFWRKFSGKPLDSWR